MVLELTTNEANILIGLIDFAVKSQGIQSAHAALFFVEKIKAAQEHEQKEAEKGSKECPTT